MLDEGRTSRAPQHSRVDEPPRQPLKRAPHGMLACRYATADAGRDELRVGLGLRPDLPSHALPGERRDADACATPHISKPWRSRFEARYPRQPWADDDGYGQGLPLFTQKSKQWQS